MSLIETQAPVNEISVYTINSGDRTYPIPILARGLWPELAHRIADGQSQSQISRELKISRTIISNTLAHPDFRKEIGRAYDNILAKLYDTKLHFQAHAEAACHAITQILADPNSTASEKLKAAALVLKGAGAIGFQTGPLVQINQNDNRTITFEDRVLDSSDPVSPEEVHEITEGVGLTADWSGEQIENKLSEPMVPIPSSEHTTELNTLNQAIKNPEPESVYIQPPITEELSVSGLIVPGITTDKREV